MAVLMDRRKVYIGTSFIVPICAYKLIYAYFLFERLWVVNPETQSDEWMVKCAWYYIHTDII